MPPLQPPGTPASWIPDCAVPTIAGGVVEVGAPRGSAGIAKAAGLVPFTRSPSTQCAIPGTFVQSVHCQNVQPVPPQFEPGTSGDALVVQCATHSLLPAPAITGESESAVFQKLGDV